MPPAKMLSGPLGVSIFLSVGAGTPRIGSKAGSGKGRIMSKGRGNETGDYMTDGGKVLWKGSKVVSRGGKVLGRASIKAGRRLLQLRRRERRESLLDD